MSNTTRYEAMTARQLIAAYLSRRLTARRSDGDRHRDTDEALVIQGVARERGLMPLLVAAFQQLKGNGWRDLPADVAKEVCK